MDFGMSLNEHAIGIIMKELIRRAMNIITIERFVFESEIKESYEGVMDDVFTTADKKSQVMFLKSIQECFPTAGIIAEEDHLKIDCSDEFHKIFFTIDPLDGTKAFIRGSSYSFGPMISLVIDGVIEAAYVGSPTTNEIFGYRPDSNSVWWISPLDNFIKLSIDVVRPLSDQYIALREALSKHSSFVRDMADGDRQLFKNYEVGGGSIGIMFSRLWKGEIGGIVLMPDHETPWDTNPVIGVSQKLGFDFLYLNEGSFVDIKREAVIDIQSVDKEMLIIHRSRLREFGIWVDKRRNI